MSHISPWQHMMHNAWKGSLCNLQTVKALFSLHIFAGWSEPSLYDQGVNGMDALSGEETFFRFGRRPFPEKFQWAEKQLEGHKSCLPCMKCITKTRLFKYIENVSTKKRKLPDEKFWYFHISIQNIDCGYLLELSQWGSSNKYPQSMFLGRNKKISVYPCKPQFYCIKVGFKRVKII